ncbi:MAG: hypothetical protein N4A47_07245 [Clostridia bacterium]|jgi:hypothetical protein|nr:hypothetical protein [Clostridia bacterium]
MEIYQTLTNLDVRDLYKSMLYSKIGYVMLYIIITLMIALEIIVAYKEGNYGKMFFNFIFVIMSVVIPFIVNRAIDLKTSEEIKMNVKYEFLEDKIAYTIDDMASEMHYKLIKNIIETDESLYILGNKGHNIILKKSENITKELLDKQIKTSKAIKVDRSIRKLMSFFATFIIILLMISAIYRTITAILN